MTKKQKSFDQLDFDFLVPDAPRKPPPAKPDEHGFIPHQHRAQTPMSKYLAGVKRNNSKRKYANLEAWEAREGPDAKVFAQFDV